MRIYLKNKNFISFLKIKKLFFLFIFFLLYFSFSNISFADKPVIGSIVTGDSVEIKLTCSECEVETPGKIIIKEPSNSFEELFTNLSVENPLTFVFDGLRLNVTYEITVTSTGTESNGNECLYYSSGEYCKATTTSSFNTLDSENIGDSSNSASSNNSFKTVIKQDLPRVLISITCSVGCGGGLEGDFTLTGDNYTQTSDIKSFRTNIPTTFVFTGLEEDKTYILSGQPYYSDNSSLKFDDYSFTMNGVDTVDANNVNYVDISPTKIGLAINSDVYTFLAPIGTIKTMNSSGCEEADKTCIGNNIGKYLNFIFKFLIGLSAALAVIMLIIAGITYMGDESVFGKTEAKSKMFSAVLGLLIALGAFALLNTINPALTGKDGVEIKQVSIEVEAPILSDANTEVPTGENNSFPPECIGGVEKIATVGGEFIVCKTLSIKFKQMLLDAKNATPTSIVLSGGGFRTRAQQIQARKNNKCPNIYTSDPSECSPPTAKPGTSMHEKGVAFDFTCDGKLINWDEQQKSQPINQSTKKCFNWLEENASNYGLSNFKKENWHWSTTGK